MLCENIPCPKAQQTTPKEKYDIGIVSFWYGLNYGSMLTSFAIYRTVEKLGYSAVHINKPKSLWSPRFTKSDSMSVIFATKYSNISPIQSQFYKLNDYCGTFLVGSDTVWNPLLVGKLQPLFSLDFVNLDKKKLSYASSFGKKHFNVSDEFLRQYCHYACSRLDAISSREESGVQIMQEVFGRTATRVLDPVFLLPADEYRAIAEDGRDITIPQKFIFSNFLRASKSKINTYKKITIKLGLQTINFPKANLKEDERESYPIDIVAKDSIENWLFSIDNAELAVSDSFHVTCFSIILRTNFITVLDPDHELIGRFETLLKLVGLEDRLVFTNDDNEVAALVKKHIDFDKVFEKLEHERNRSLSWLKKALATPPAKRDHQRKVIDNIIINFRKQVEITEDLLCEAQKKLSPLEALNTVNDKQQHQSGKDHLRSSFVIRYAFRIEYWRCRIMQQLATKNRQHYLDRIKALKLAIEILIH